MAGMSRNGIEIWRVNAFTTQPFTGNPAGVVPAAAGLSDELMQSIANEVNDISETAFILPPEQPGNDIRLRYFTSSTEVDLCGHATISALYTLYWRGDVAGTEGTRVLRAETRVGTLELGLEFRAGQLQAAVMEQLEPRHAAAPGARHAHEVLGLPQSAIAADLPIACCSTGLWVCYVPLTDAAQLARIELRRDRIARLWSDNPELAGVYAFALTGPGTTQARFFSPPKYGILEDPVTGTASGGLGGYLIANGLLAPDGVLHARQGVEMGRPGEVRVQRRPNGRMCISGQAVAVIRGQVLI